MEKTRNNGLQQGLRYVYLGNIFGHAGENTYCPKCGQTLIAREGLEIRAYKLSEGKCKFYGYEIAGRF